MRTAYADVARKGGDLSGVADTNIKLGAAYRQRLLTRYLRAVDDLASRL